MIRIRALPSMDKDGVVVVVLEVSTVQRDVVPAAQQTDTEMDRAIVGPPLLLRVQPTGIGIGVDGGRVREICLHDVH